MKRIFIVAVLLVVLSLGGAGCMQKESTQNNRRQNSNDAALEYMEQKYGEKFEYAAPWGDSMSGDHEILVTCESLGDEDIVVEISNYRDEDRVFHDNYLAVKYCEETRDFLGQCANEVFGESKVYYSVSKGALSPELPADASFEEYLADEELNIRSYIAVKASSFTEKEQGEKVMEPIFSACEGAEYLSIILVVVDDDEYESLDVLDVQDAKTLGRKLVNRELFFARMTRQKNGDETLEWLGEE